MTRFIDKRNLSKNKSTVNRQRFIRRFRNQIKKAVSDAVAKRSITDIEAGETVSIPAEETHEPTMRHSQSGIHEAILPGNKEYVKGDKIKKPQDSQASKGSRASNTGEGTDDFVFNLSREEFLDMFFEDMELPNIKEKDLTSISNHQYVRAGYTKDGVPTNINVRKSLSSACARRIAVAGGYKKQLAALQDKLAQFEQQNLPPDHPDLLQLLDDIATIKYKIEHIPFIDEFDIRYNRRVKELKPSSQAVMFCIMDVSGSMDEVKKDIAKRFFILLYLFLKKNYDKIDMVFIRHHTIAKEVDEDEFFYSRETGGTVVSSALELMKGIVKDHYPPNAWNIYGAQASDGDNWNADSPICEQLLVRDVLPAVQYYAYIEIMPRHHQSLWSAYTNVKYEAANFSMRQINNHQEIYPVLHDLFKAKEHE